MVRMSLGDGLDVRLDRTTAFPPAFCSCFGASLGLWEPRKRLAVRLPKVPSSFLDGKTLPVPLRVEAFEDFLEDSEGLENGPQVWRMPSQSSRLSISSFDRLSLPGDEAQQPNRLLHEVALRDFWQLVRQLEKKPGELVSYIEACRAA